MKIPQSIWRSIWFQALPAEAKLGYLFLLGNSGPAGVWKIGWEMVASILGIQMQLADFLRCIEHSNPLESDDQETPYFKLLDYSVGTIWLARACKEAIYGAITYGRRKDMREMIAEIEKYNLTDMLRVYCPDVRIVGKPDKRELTKAGAKVKEDLALRIPTLPEVIEASQGVIPISEAKAFLFYHEQRKWEGVRAWRDALLIWIEEYGLRLEWGLQGELKPWPRTIFQKQAQIKLLREQMAALANDKEVPAGGTIPIIKKEAREKMERLNQFLQLLKKELNP